MEKMKTWIFDFIFLRGITLQQMLIFMGPSLRLLLCPGQHSPEINGLVRLNSDLLNPKQRLNGRALVMDRNSRGLGGGRSENKPVYIGIKWF